jgi:mxaC protein
VLDNGWLAFAPRDRLSDARLGPACAATLALAALALALAGPHRPEYTVERVGQGAEIVLVLDRSRSMDQGFAPNRTPPPGLRPNSPEALTYYFSQTPGRLRDSKGKVARQLLSEFTAKRPDDRFALVAFSTLPMRILDFTSKPEVIQAAIEAGNIGRGLSETHIGRALEAALEAFDGRPYTGSRIIMLVSDGGDRLDEDTRERLLHQTRKQRVSIYWLYLRSANSPGLTLAADDSPAAADSVPELLLHNFFNRWRRRTAPTRPAIRQRCRRPSTTSTASRSCPSPTATWCRAAIWRPAARRWRWRPCRCCCWPA